MSDRERSDMLYSKQALKLKNPDRERESGWVTERGKYRERSDMLYSKQALKFKNPERERVTERGKYRERSDMLYSKQALILKNPETGHNARSFFVTFLISPGTLQVNGSNFTTQFTVRTYIIPAP